MRTLFLRVAYDGTDFSGWQAQPERRTVQGVLEAAVRKVLEDESIAIVGAGRTDAGVHARGQGASFVTASALPARAVGPLVNRRLPGDVRVRAVREVPAGFHARRSARARRYAYRLLRDDDLLLGRYAWRPRGPLAAEALDRATRTLEREADFSAFRGAGSSPTVPVCRLFRARWRDGGRTVRFDVVADHFLYHMVRNIVGTALAVAREPDPAAAMRAVLESGDRRRAGVTAPARGLCLERVYYGGRISE